MSQGKKYPLLPSPEKKTKAPGLVVRVVLLPIVVFDVS